MELVVLNLGTVNIRCVQAVKPTDTVNLILFVIFIADKMTREVILNIELLYICII